MSNETLLFLLRAVSAVVLLTFLFILFWFLWRDFQTANTPETRRTIYGRLTRVAEQNGTYVSLDVSFPLLPLTSLGRAPSNAVLVDDTFASSDHAVVALRNGRWWLEDRQSTNGTLLNNIPIQQPVIVTDGDIISIGQTHYRLELER